MHKYFADMNRQLEGRKMRRPLFSVLAAAAAAIGISVLIIPWNPCDYEPWRDCTVVLTGTICGMEPALEGKGIVWKVILSDLVLNEIEEKESPKPASESIKPAFGSADLSLNGTGESGKANTVITGTGKSVRTTPASTGTGKSGSVFRPVSSGSGFEKKSRVLCIMDREPDVDMSARVRVRGKLSLFRRARNEGNFDLCRYYHILRVEFSVRDAEILAVSPPTDRLAAILYSVKRILSAGADRVFTVENAPVVKAVLLGEKGLLDDDTKELYQGAGIIHIFSISGLHITLIGTGVLTLLGLLRIPLPVRAAAALAVIYLYGKMIGMGTSVFRAIVMFSLYLIAKAIGRTYDLLTAAGIACLLLLLDQPLYFLHTGFLFTFAAVLSIGILIPALPGKVLKIFAVPLGTLPVCLWMNGTFPLFSLLLNLVVIPLMTAVMASAGLAVLIGTAGSAAVPVREAFSFFCPAASMAARIAGSCAASAQGVAASSGSVTLLFARIAGLPAELILDLYRVLADLSAKLPGYEIVLGRPSAAQIILYYAMLFALSACSDLLQMPHIRQRIEKGRDAGASCSLRKENSVKGRGRLLQDSFLERKPGCDPAGLAGAGLRKEDTVKSTGRLRQNSSLEINPSRVLVGLACHLCRIAHAVDNRERRRLGCLCAAAWIAGSVFVLSFRLSPSFEMVFLYVGQGDGIYISSQGRHFLIDGGSSSEKDLARYTLVPFLHCRGVSRLEGVILTHDDYDHCSGLLDCLEAAAEGKKKIGIETIYLPEIDPRAKGEHYLRIEELAEKTGIRVQYISRGRQIRSGKLTLACLHPAKGAFYEDANASSTTLCLRYGDFSALLTGDLEGEGEKDLLGYLKRSLAAVPDPGTRDDSRDGSCLLRTSLLKVAHHGSRNATSDEFLASFHADFAVISAGVNNMYGHPNPELLQRLTDAGISCDRTDQSGMITVGIKGGRFFIRDFLQNSQRQKLE